jgi:hypothetical protein
MHALLGNSAHHNGFMHAGSAKQANPLSNSQPTSLIKLIAQRWQRRIKLIAQTNRDHAPARGLGTARDQQRQLAVARNQAERRQRLNLGR